MSGSSKKAVVKTSSPESAEHQVRFEPRRFNELVFDKGYEVYIDKALRCPCAVKGNGQALITCDNCIGTGWIFIDRLSTRIGLQGINADVKYVDWSKLSTGMARVTARAVDRLAFMDRIILREAEGYHNEILRTKVYGQRKTCFTTYEILEVETIKLFDSDKNKLVNLTKNDYVVEDEKIVFDSKFNSLPDMTITIRYRHLLTYHIIDTNRDVIQVRTLKGCKSDEELQSMPMSFTARKAHYLFDNNKFEEAKRLIENSQ